MQDIAENLIGLKGVKAACLFVDEENFASTFDDDKNDGVLATAEMVREYFSAIDSVDKQYHELFFSLPDSYFVAFFVDEEMPLVFLLIEKKINLPLVNMGVKAAMVKLKKQQEDRELVEPTVAFIAEPDPEPEKAVEAVTGDAVINKDVLAGIDVKANEPISKEPEKTFEKPAFVEPQSDAQSVTESKSIDASNNIDQGVAFQGTKPLVSIVSEESNTESESGVTEPAPPTKAQVTHYRGQKVVREAPKDASQQKKVIYRGKKVTNDNAPEREVFKKPTLKYSGDNPVSSTPVNVEAVEQKKEKKKKSLFSWGRKKTAEESAQPNSSVASPVIHTSDNAIHVTSSEGINALQKELSDELINYLGPAASFVFQDVVEKWQDTYLQKTSNLGHLVEMLLDELDSDDEKHSYREAARKILA